MTRHIPSVCNIQYKCTFSINECIQITFTGVYNVITTNYRVATAQRKQEIWLSSFPDNENTWNLSCHIF